MRIPILMYHQIDRGPPRGTPLRGLVVEPGAFARQLGLLKALGWRGVSMRDAAQALRGASSGGPAEKLVAITFDDGYLNNLHNALPALVKNGFTATCYAVSRRIGKTNDWDAHLGIASRPLMGPADFRQWQQAGMEVGSHTRDHVNLLEVSDDEAWSQIADSKRELEDLTGEAVRHFCYPYGRYDARHRDMVAAAGYLSATTVARGHATPKDHPHELPRVMVAHATHPLQFLLKVLTRREDSKGGRT